MISGFKGFPLTRFVNKFAMFKKLSGCAFLQKQPERIAIIRHICHFYSVNYTQRMSDLQVLLIRKLANSEIRESPSSVNLGVNHYKNTLHKMIWLIKPYRESRVNMMAKFRLHQSVLSRVSQVVFDYRILNFKTETSLPFYDELSFN